MKVYQAINAVQTELAKIGISKSSRNSQGAGYNFRGIDAVYNVLSSIMAQHGLCIIPRMLTRACEERTSKSGGALFYVTVEAEFDLVSAEDGSKHTARTFGEAMDSGDKATNKAMSAAYKYMAFQTFAIPTEGDNDADSHTHEVATKKPTLDAKRLQGAIEKIIAGQYTTDKLRDTFALTAAQEKQVMEALANA
jgi:ERF superfamily